MDVFGTLLRVVLVFALLALVLWVLKRTDRGRGGRTGAPVQVIGSTRLSKGASLTVVRIGDEEVVLGVTDSSVSVLGSGPAPQPATDAATDAATHAVAVPVGSAASAGSPARPDFATALNASLARTLGPTGARLLTGAVGRAAPATTELSDAAVAAALASVRGDEPAAPRVPAPRVAPAVPPVAPGAPADDLPDPVSRAVLHRAVTRTRARTA